MLLQLFVLLAVSVVGSQIHRPHIVFLLADDLGFNDLGFWPYSRHRNSIFSPNLKAIARKGVRFDNYYVQPICTPTRSALMTGRYDIRLGTQSGVIRPWEAAAIALNETFMAQNMKDAGYDTAIMGKWHLGFYKEKYLPQKRGFDFQYGYYCGAEDYYQHTREGSGIDGNDWHLNDSRIHLEDKGKYSAPLLADHAISYMKERENNTKPFFLYLPFQSVHEPFEVDEKWKNLYPYKKGKAKTKAGMVSAMDHAMGRIFEFLNHSSLYNNTLVVFSSDNGAPRDSGGSNLPLRGWKTQLWEGGLKVAGFVFHPNLPKEVAGTINHQLYHVTDWLPTLVNLAGGNTSRNLPLDGKDIWHSIMTNTPSPRYELLHNINPKGCPGPNRDLPHAAIRQGDMKFLAECFDAQHGVTGDTWMFNITADPDETNNIVQQHPNLVKHFEKRLHFYIKGMIPPLQSCSGCPEGKPFGNPPAWNPWMKD